MKKKEIKKDSSEAEDKNALPGYLPYPGADDIYARAEQEPDIDPEDISKTKTPNDETDSEGRGELDFDDVISGRGRHERRDASGLNEKDFEGHMSGRDLDVPGSELDDDLEDNGDEDEENNSYSIGGDRHDDLEEDKGE
jgi:hypothetical protein